MKKLILQSITFLLFLPGAITTFATPPNIPPGLLEEARNSFIFVFTADVNAKDVPGLAKRLAKHAGGSVRHVYKKALKGFSANMSATAAANVAAKNPNIAYYEHNGVASIPIQAQKKGGNKPPSNPPADPPSQITPWGITRVGSPHSGLGKNACIIDSGVDTNNPDLIVGTGRNFVNNAKKPDDISDKNGHGTHVAGILAAIDNDIGVVGVAESATIIPLRVFGASGQGFIDDIIEALDYILDESLPCDVVNMSLEAYGQFDSLTVAVETVADSGYKFAICAGNNSDYANLYDPARAVGTNIYTVSSIDKNDVFADFSNYGNPPIDYAAPGVDVESYVLNGTIQSWQGCSMATPHVAGILLLGDIVTNGYAINDPDGNPDPIAHF